jgi:hypothetical protein
VYLRCLFLLEVKLFHLCRRADETSFFVTRLWVIGKKIKCRDHAWNSDTLCSLLLQILVVMGVAICELRRMRAISGNQAKVIFSETNALGTFSNKWFLWSIREKGVILKVGSNNLMTLEHIDRFSWIFWNYHFKSKENRVILKCYWSVISVIFAVIDHLWSISEKQMVRSHLNATSWRLLSLSTTWRACLGKSVTILWLKTHARLQLPKTPATDAIYLPHNLDSYHDCRADWILTYPQHLSHKSCVWVKMVLT